MRKRDKTTVPINPLDKNVTNPIAPSDRLIGHRIGGRYELIEPLAKGGFGRVYKARDTKLERIVAIKLVDPGKASDDTRSRMLREARANARLHHPNVVVLHDAGEDPNGLYLVLEYVAGTSLADVLANGPMEPYRAVEIMLECATAISAAHAHGIVHRDVKPANILLTESGRVKVADFGVARMVGEARLTDRGSIIGTPNYMAPEQIDGTEVGASADMFALGCVFYEMLAGRPPFDGKTTSEVLGRILRASPDPMPPLDHSIAPLVDAITALLDRNPDRRLTPHELTIRLRSWERREGARSSGFGRRSKAALIGVAAVLAAIVGASLALRDQPETLPPPPDIPPMLVRVAETPGDAGPIIEERIRFSNRDALFAFVEFIGRDRGNFKRVDDRTITIEGATASVRMRMEEARVIDQLLGHDVFRERSLFNSSRPSQTLVSCDFDAIQPSEIIALFSAAAGWPVVQSADVPLENSKFLRISAESRPWDELMLSVLRAAGLSVHRYETIWLVTAEDVPVAPRSKVAVIFPRRYSTEDVRQKADAAMSERGIAWTVEVGGNVGLVVVDGATGVDAVLEQIDQLRGPDWQVINPRRFTGPPTSLRLESAPIADVLDFYENLTRQALIVDPDIKGWVRANIVDIPADEYLAAVLDANGLTVIENDQGLSVKPFFREVIDVRLRNTPGSMLEPLAAYADYATEVTGVSTSIAISEDAIRIEGRSDVARDVAVTARTIDNILAGRDQGM